MAADNLGELLRQMRVNRGLTQGRLADAAQVTTRALRYWEKNQQQPGDWELESVLRALEATPQEKGQVLQGLKETRSVRLIHTAGLLPEVSPALLGDLPGIGDLLRSMRLRQGWTQEQFASELRVSRATVVRWEATQHFPSDEDIERLCLLLNASPEEAQALRAKRLVVASFPAEPTLEECAHLYALLVAIRDGNFALLPLLDLYALTLKRHLRFLPGPSARVLDLLAEVEVLHGWWLHMQGRKAEAHTMNWRVLNLTRGPMKPQLASIRALNVLSAHAARSASNSENGIKFLFPWLRHLPLELHPWLLCDMAYYAGMAQQPDAAFAFLQQAERVMDDRDADQPLRQAHFRLTKARVLLQTGNPVKAMEWLPPLSSGDGRIHELMIWAETFLAAGDRATAERYAAEARTLLSNASLPARQKKLERLTQRI